MRAPWGLLLEMRRCAGTPAMPAARRAQSLGHGGGYLSPGRASPHRSRGNTPRSGDVIEMRVVPMRSRISGRGLLPAALAAASVVAVAAPASAQEGPPPGPATSTTTTSTPDNNDDCARAVRVLSVLKLLPSTPDLGKVLCSANTAD